MPIPTITRRRMLQASAAAGAAGTLMPAAARARISVPRIRADSDIQYLDPMNQIGGLEETVKAACLVTLVRFSASGTTEVAPYAAREIAWISDRDVRFVLHDNILWTGGYGRVSADDVKFSFERIADPEAGSPWQYTWESLDHVEVVDELTGIIHLKQPFAPLFVSSLPTLGGNILSRRAVTEAGGSFTTELPAQCGPYLMTQWQPKARLVLERNPDWTLDHPDFDGFDMVIITDDKAAELAFEAGELDFSFVSVDSIERYRNDPPAGSHLIEAPSSNYSWLGMNVDHPRLGDIRVRHAIKAAIDVDQILEGAYGGQAAPSTGVQSPGTVGWRPAKLFTGPDLGHARALLAEAGVPDGFEVTLTCINDTIAQNVAQIIQAQLAEVGIVVELRVYDPGVYWNLGLESEGEDWKDLQLTLMEYAAGVDPSENLVWFTPEQVGVWNWERFDNAEFGDLYRKGTSELDPEVRNAIYVRMQDIMEESGAYVFITHGVKAVLTSDHVAPFLRFSKTLALPQFKSV